MPRLLRIFLMLILWTIVSTVFAASQGKSNPIEPFTRTGKTQQCLPTHSIQDATVIDDSNILFRINGSKYYLNHLHQACPQLRQYGSFTYTLHGQTEVCDMDIITVLTGVTTPQGILHGASCGLGKFERLERKPD